jgi:predicted nuclease with TOPRIM domain
MANYVKEIQTFAYLMDKVKPVLAEAKQFKKFKARDFAVFLTTTSFFLSDLNEYIVSAQKIDGMQLRIENKLLTKHFTIIKNKCNSAVAGFVKSELNRESLLAETLEVIEMVKDVKRGMAFKARKADMLPINAVKLSSFDELNNYIDRFKTMDTQIEKASEKPNELKPASPTTVVDPDKEQKLLPPTIDKTSIELESIFTHLKPLIKVPKLSQEKPWALAKLPVFVFCHPTLNTNALRTLGIKYHTITNGIILENQLVLCLLSTYVPQEGDTKKQKKSELKIDQSEGIDPVYKTPLFIRAENMINTQFNTDFYYSKSFSAKEVGQPIKFVWMLSPKQLNLLGRFKIKVIGLPFAPDLKKAEDLTNDALHIKDSLNKENAEKESSFNNKKETFKPLLEERDRLSANFFDVKAKISVMKKSIQKLTSEVEYIAKTYEKEQNRASKSKLMELKLVFERTNFQLQKAQKELDAYVNIHLPIIKEQLSVFEEKFKQAFKNYK